MSSVASSLQARTGRTLDEWVRTGGGRRRRPARPERRPSLAARRARRAAEQPVGDRRRRRQGRRLGRDRRSRSTSTPSTSGAKAALRPIFDHIHAIASCPRGRRERARAVRRTSRIVRGRQFAAVAPATRRRVDLGLRYVDPPASGRLVPTRAPGQSTHKIILERTARSTRRWHRCSGWRTSRTAEVSRAGRRRVARTSRWPRPSRRRRLPAWRRRQRDRAASRPGVSRRPASLGWPPRCR